MKKLICGVLLVLLLSQSLSAESFPQDYALSSIQRINLIIEELEQLQTEKENYYRELENINSERKNELLEREQELRERLNDIKQREKELKELKMRLELFGDLIDNQAIYIKSLNQKLTFWKIFSGILATSLITTLVIKVVNK